MRDFFGSLRQSKALACVPLSMGLLAMVSGCQTHPPSLAPFVVSENAQYLGTGSGAVEGQVIARKQGGELDYDPARFGAGIGVFLMPDTPHFFDWVNQKHSEEWVHKMDRAALKFIRETNADASGHFTFENIPNGKYIVYAAIWWQYFSEQYDSRTGGPVFVLVDIANGEHKRVVLH